MDAILTLLILASLVMFIIGMVNPEKAVPLNLPKKRGIVALLYLGCILLFGIILGASSTSDEQVSNNPNQQTIGTQSQQNSEVQQSTQNTEEESSIGKIINVGYFEYTVNSVRFKKTIGDEFFGETADGIYLLVDLTIKNIDTETRTLDGSFFAVTDADGIKFEYSINGSTALELSGGKTLFMKECQPKIPTKGTLIFEVPEKGEYYLHLIGNFWGNRSVRVLLR